jgi:hypothetical protein
MMSNIKFVPCSTPNENETEKVEEVEVEEDFVVVVRNTSTTYRVWSSPLCASSEGLVKL